jgi:prepilin-type processing-associated H-X9-DG protein
MAADLTKRTLDLQQVGVAINSYHDANKKMPGSADDLAPLLTPEIASRVRDGDIQVVWNAAPAKDQKDALSTIVIAWDNNVAIGDNRMVLFMDGHAAAMPEQQFKTAPKPLPAKE